jgi:hypothetical protein
LGSEKRELAGERGLEEEEMEEMEEIRKSWLGKKEMVVRVVRSCSCEKKM